MFHPKNALHAALMVRLINATAVMRAANLERLGRHEVHLDRKLERMPAMLLRFKELRGGEVAP
jgi:hypothetical protein